MFGDFDDTERCPAHNSEAEVALGFASGKAALQSGRRSVPSLVMAGRDFAAVVRKRERIELATRHGS
ncbi:hypothetical protein [Streptomyces sp. NPDC002133]|uniref:hypothetical protein n=1 Tax=Streptomyces sp. NPDC002133 TaxID=3154409 RepID=UPI00332766DB